MPRTSLQEAADDLLLGFLLGQAEGHELVELLTGDLADGRLVVVDSIGADSPKTKAFAQKLKAMGLESVMIITKEVDENLYLASRNLKNVFVVEPRYADPLSLIFYKKVVVTKDAIAQLEEMWG